MKDLQWQRVISLLLAGAYVISAFARSDLVAGLQMIVFCALALGCIWFPEALGEYVGGRVTEKSPSVFVHVLGWVVLLVPLLERAFWYFEGGRDWFF